MVLLFSVLGTIAFLLAAISLGWKFALGVLVGYALFQFGFWGCYGFWFDPISPKSLQQETKRSS